MSTSLSISKNYYYKRLTIRINNYASTNFLLIKNNFLESINEVLSHSKRQGYI